MASKPVQVIANPNAGNGKASRLLPRVERGLRAMGVAAVIRRTRSPGHAGDLAREAAESGASRILVVGGDGTIHEVANGLLGLEGQELPLLAILPVGTGNDFHRMVRARGGVDRALQVLRDGVPRPFDVGRVRWEGGQRYFVNLLGVGVDTEVLRRREGFTWLSGIRQYLAALSAALLRFRCVPLGVELDRNGEGGIRADVLLAAVTVGPSIGGGFLVSPGALPDDGLLDLFVVERLTLFQVMRYIPRVLRGTLDGEPEIHMRRVAALRFRSLDGRPFAFELDGELMPVETPLLDIEVRAACLPVLELPEARP